MIRLCWIKRISLLLTLISLVLFIRSLIASSGQEDWSDLNVSVAKPADTECLRNMYCSTRKKMILMRPGSRTMQPIVCWNNKKLFDDSKIREGFAIAVLNGRKNNVRGVHYLNLEDGGYSIIKVLAQVRRYEIVVGTSYGDVSSKVSREARKMMRRFGILMEQYKNGSSILFLGQLGFGFHTFEKVTALEMKEPLYYLKCLDKTTEKSSNVTVRWAVPEDELTVTQLADIKGRNDYVKYGKELPNCGNSLPCPKGQIAMSFYSGKDKDDAPRLCVNGRFVIDRNLNFAGRGLNLVVIDSKTHQVLRTGHFDTYLEGSSDLILFLEQLTPGEILAVVSFDEVSNSLSDIAKHIFYELGSSLIQRIKFRASWYFIGQKGIDGYTPFEDMNLPSGSGWAKPINLFVCVPSVLSGLKTAISWQQKIQNMPRRHFCSRYDGYEDFCDENRLDKPLIPRVGHSLLPSTDLIYSVPIVLAGGLRMNNIRLCLESIYDQDGINPQNVIVGFDSSYGEIADLSALFRVRAVPFNESHRYGDYVMEAIDYTMTLFPTAPCLIVIEEDTILLPGFLYFLGQLLPHFLKDDSANVILTLNINGYDRLQHDFSSVFRTDVSTASGAYMMKRSFYEEYIIEKKRCCRETKYGWLVPGISYVPSLSRVVHDKKIDLEALDEDRNEFDRSSFYVNILDGDEKINNGDRLGERSYDEDIRKMVVAGRMFHVNESFDCREDAFTPSREDITDNTTPIVILVYEKNTNTLLKVAHCFNLIIMMFLPWGSYKEALRFSTARASYVLIASSSPFLQDKPLNTTQ